MAGSNASKRETSSRAGSASENFARVSPGRRTPSDRRIAVRQKPPRQRRADAARAAREHDDAVAGTEQLGARFARIVGATQNSP